MNLKTLTAGLLLLASLCLARAQETETDIFSIASLVSDENYEVALDSLNLLAQRDSLDDAVWYYKGLCEAETGRRKQAAVSFRRAISLDPANPDYRSSSILSLIADDELYNLGNDSLAHTLYSEAIEKEPLYAPALLGLAESDRMGGNLAAFFADADSFLRLDFISTWAKTDYVKQFLERVDGPTYQLWHKQIDAMPETIAQVHPSDSTALVFAGSWFWSTGRKEKGAEYFVQWLNAEPDNINAQMLFISIIQEMDGREAAISACDSALEHCFEAKDRSAIIETKASYLYMEGKEKEAFKLLDRALILTPDNISLLNNYAYYLSLSRKHLRKAEKMSRRTVEADPDNVSFLDTYGWILHLLGRNTDAKIQFKRAMIYGGKESDEVLFHYSEVLKALGEQDMSDYYKRLYESKKK